MFDVAPILLAVGFEAFVPAYWICLIVGGGLLVISALAGASHLSSAHGDVDLDIDADFDVDFGGIDADMDADFDFDADVPDDFDIDVAHAHSAGDALDHADAAGGALSLSSWFSLRFVVFAAAGFGFLGVVMTHTSDVGGGVTLVVASVGGLAIGQTVHQIIRKIRKTSGNSALSPQDYLNRPARVTVAITHPDKGEIAVQIRDAERFLPAITRRAQTGFKIGDQAYVIAYRGGVAEVVSPREYEFLTYKGRGGSQ